MNNGLYPKYFVLKPFSKDMSCPYAAASRHALITYANFIDFVDPDLAAEIKAWVGKV